MVKYYDIVIRWKSGATTYLPLGPDGLQIDPPWYTDRVRSYGSSEGEAVMNMIGTWMGACRERMRDTRLVSIAEVGRASACDTWGTPIPGAETTGETWSDIYVDHG